MLLKQQKPGWEPSLAPLWVNFSPCAIPNSRSSLDSKETPGKYGVERKSGEIREALGREGGLTFSPRVPQHRVCHHHDGSLQHVGQDKDMELLQALVHRLL